LFFCWDEHEDHNGEWLNLDKITHPPLRKFLGHLEKVKALASDKPDLLGQWDACCPVHGDTNPSMAIGGGRMAGSALLSEGTSNPDPSTRAPRSPTPAPPAHHINAMPSKMPPCACAPAPLKLTAMPQSTTAVDSHAVSRP